MTRNGNSVNIARDDKAYHHGDLRSALVETGLEMLRNRSVDELSLREMARTVGVSATAVYRHFSDKQALLRALAMEGLDMLARNQKRAASDAGGGREGLVESGLAYVRFAVDHPALFRLIMGKAPAVDLLTAPDDRVGEAMRGLRLGIAEVNQGGEPGSRAEILAAWSMVHGAAMLTLDGLVAYDEELVRAMLSRRFAR
ncbi:MAG: TetR/AcrR family transcriptional regulator [Blastomonas sp.]